MSSEAPATACSPASGSSDTGSSDDPDSSGSPSGASDDTEPDGQGPDEQGPDEQEPGEQVSTEAGTDEMGPSADRPRRPYLRRGAVALAAAGFVAVGVGAFAWAVPSPEAANQRFVEAAQSQGHVVAAGRQESLVISAARKICERRVTHETDQERRATALSSDEIAAVSTAFGADTRDFTTLALETFCSS